MSKAIGGGTEEQQLPITFVGRLMHLIV